MAPTESLQVCVIIHVAQKMPVSIDFSIQSCHQSGSPHPPLVTLHSSQTFSGQHSWVFSLVLQIHLHWAFQVMKLCTMWHLASDFFHLIIFFKEQPHYCKHKNATPFIAEPPPLSVWTYKAFPLLLHQLMDKWSLATFCYEHSWTYSGRYRCSVFLGAMTTNIDCQLDSI